VTASALSSIPAEHSGMAASMTNTSRELGAVTGVAVLGSLVNGVVIASLVKRLTALGIPKQFQSQVVAAVTTGTFNSQSSAAARQNPGIAKIVTRSSTPPGARSPPGSTGRSPGRCVDAVLRRPRCLHHAGQRAERRGGTHGKRRARHLVAHAPPPQARFQSIGAGLSAPTSALFHVFPSSSFISFEPPPQERLGGPVLMVVVPIDGSAQEA